MNILNQIIITDVINMCRVWKDERVVLIRFWNIRQLGLQAVK